MATKTKMTSAPPKDSPKDSMIGKKAPSFKLPSNTGDVIDLKDYAGKTVVLFFYPKDMTPGCTQEACDFRDQYTRFKKQGAVVFGISKDPVNSHTKFVEKYELPFLLLSDETGAVCEKYGVWKEKSMYGKKYMGIDRSTFIIDGTQKITHAYRSVKVTNHVDEVFEAISNL